MHFYLQAKVLDSAARIDLLRSHPALVARLFEFKQDCIWKYLVMGEAKPFGEVTDNWRRVKVIFNYTILIIYCICL